VEVHQDDVRPFAAGELDRLGAVAGRLEDVELPVAQRVAERLGE
jgi:hypothetical protein